MRIFSLLAFVLISGAQFAQTTVNQLNAPPSEHRFIVDSVEIATIRLNEMNAQKAFENQLEKEIQFFPRELKDEQVVPGWGNCFVATIHKSFDEHRPLTLSPDVIWMAIAQGVSIHINENFKELEPFIFKTNKPDKISVRNDELSYNSEDLIDEASTKEPWADLLQAYSDSTTAYVNDDYYDFFVPEFSTTTSYIHASYEVTMLEGFSQAFEYFGDSGCGIPYITLLGTEDDWRAIYQRIDKIEELGMKTWAEELRAVLKQFIRVYEKDVDRSFWQDIYKNHLEYGTSYVSGWFIKFFPYLEMTGELEPAEDPKGIYYSRAAKEYKENSFLEGNRYLISRLETDDFPSGISEIDVHWNDFGTQREMKVHAGFYAIKQYDDLSLEPAISWAVRDKKGKDAYHDYSWTNSETNHRHVYWTPVLMQELEEVAIYSKEEFSSTDASYAFVKEHIIDYVEKNSYFSYLNLEGKSVDLLISSDGTIIESTCPELEEMVLLEITKAVEALPKKWTPAIADVRNVREDYYVEDDDGMIIPVAVNSLVRFEF